MGPLFGVLGSVHRGLVFSLKISGSAVFDVPGVHGFCRPAAYVEFFRFELFDGLALRGDRSLSLLDVRGCRVSGCLLIPLSVYKPSISQHVLCFDRRLFGCHFVALGAYSSVLIFYSS